MSGKTGIIVLAIVAGALTGGFAAVALGAGAAGVIAGGYAGAALFGFFASSATKSAPQESSPTEVRDLGFNRTEQGTPVPIVYGKFLLWGPMVWIGTFEQKIIGGGGGGGDKGAPPTPGKPIFDGEFILGVSEGPIIDVKRLWRGEKDVTKGKDLPEGEGNFEWKVKIGDGTEGIWSKVKKKEGVKKAVAFRNLAHVRYSGSIGQSNTIPRMAAMVIGRDLDTLFIRTKNESTHPSGGLLPQLINAEYDVRTGYVFGTDSAGSKIYRIPRQADEYSPSVDTMSGPDSLVAQGYTFKWAGYWHRRDIVVALMTKSASPTYLVAAPWGVSSSSGKWVTYNLGTDSSIRGFDSGGGESFGTAYLCADSGMFLASSVFGGLPYITYVSFEDWFETTFSIQPKDFLISSKYTEDGDHKVYVGYIPHLNHVIISGMSIGSPPVARWGYFIPGKTPDGELEGEVTHTTIKKNQTTVNINKVQGIGWFGDTIFSFRPYDGSTDSASVRFVEISFERETYISTHSDFPVPDITGDGVGDISLTQTKNGVTTYTHHHTMDPAPTYVSFNVLAGKFCFIGRVSSSYPNTAIAGGQAIYTLQPENLFWSVFLPNGDYAIHFFDQHKMCSGPVYDIMTHTRYGAGIPPSILDIQSFEEAEGWCRSRIFFEDKDNSNKVSTIPRHRFNFGVERRQELVLTLREFMTSWGGAITARDKLRLSVKRPEVGFMAHIKEADIVEGSARITIANPRQIPNRIRVRYFHVSGKKKKQRHRIASANFEFDQDLTGEVRENTVDAKGITDQQSAQRFAEAILSAAWANRITLDLTVPLRHSYVFPGDLVIVTHSRFSLNRKLFLVSEKEEDTDGNYKLTLIEHNPRVFDPGPIDVEELDTSGIDNFDSTNVPYPGRFIPIQWASEFSAGLPDTVSRLRVLFATQPTSLEDLDKSGEPIRANEDSSQNVGPSFVEWKQLTDPINGPDEEFVSANDNDEYTDGNTAQAVTSAMLASPFSSTDVSNLRIFAVISHTGSTGKGIVPDPEGSVVEPSGGTVVLVWVTDYRNPAIFADPDTFSSNYRWEAIKYPRVSTNLTTKHAGDLKLTKVDNQNPLIRAVDGLSAGENVTNVGQPQDFSFVGFDASNPIQGEWRYLIVDTEGHEDFWGSLPGQDPNSFITTAITDKSTDLFNGLTSGSGVKLFKNYDGDIGSSEILYIGDTRVFNTVAIRFDKVADKDVQLAVEYPRRNTQTGLLEWVPLSLVVDRTVGFSSKKNSIVVPEIDPSNEKTDWEYLVFGEPADWLPTIYVREEIDPNDPLLTKMPLIDETIASGGVIGAAGGTLFWIRLRRTRVGMKDSELPKILKIRLSRRPYAVFREEKAPYLEADPNDLINTTGIFDIRVYTVSPTNDDHPIEQRPHLPGNLTFISSFVGGDSDSGRNPTSGPAPSEIFINGKSALRKTVTVPSNSDIVISWFPTAYRGSFGLAPYGREDYGGSFPVSFKEYVIRIVDTDSGSIVREVRIEDAETVTYTYTVSENQSDHRGTWKGTLRFDITEDLGNRAKSLPVSATTKV